MKKYIILLTCILFTTTSYATCSINNNTTCSIANFREKVPPIYNTQRNMKVKEFSKSPTTQLKSLNRSKENNKMGDFRSSENKSSYNSSCQFGVCLQNRSTPLFQKPKQ